MTRPPSGMPPPTSATLDGAVIELMPLATVLCAPAGSVRGYSPGD